MTKTVDFIFDFGSPNAYFVHKMLPALAQRTGAVINYSPVLLGGVFKSTNNQSPMLAYAHIPAKLDYEMLELRRFVAQHRLDKFVWNPHFPVNTLMLMRGAWAVQTSADLSAYVDAAFGAVWEQGHKMDDGEVMGQVLSDAGLDGAAILERTQDPEVKAKLLNATDAAVARGVFGVPTIFVGEEMFFGKERLGQVEAEILK